MSAEQQEKFAAYLRERFTPDTPYYLWTFKEFIEDTLGRTIEHWRKIDPKDARRVMKRADDLTK